MTVVKSAIVTSQKNAVGERTPRSAPMLMTTSAMSARVFIRSPIDSDSFQARPARRAASAVAPNFVAHDTAMTSRSAPQSRGSVPSDPRSVRSPEKTKKIGRKKTATRSPMEVLMASARSRLKDPATPTRKPPRMEKTPRAFVAVARPNATTSTPARAPAVRPPEGARATRIRATPNRPSSQKAAAGFAARTSRSNGNSRPIRSMSRISPICARADRIAVVSRVRSAVIAPGYKWPRTEGPRTTPPRISPTTGGCPARPKIQLEIRAAATMIARSAQRRRSVCSTPSGLAAVTGGPGQAPERLRTCQSADRSGRRCARVARGRALRGGGSASGPSRPRAPPRASRSVPHRRVPAELGAFVGPTHRRRGDHEGRVREWPRIGALDQIDDEDARPRPEGLQLTGHGVEGEVGAARDEHDLPAVREGASDPARHRDVPGVPRLRQRALGAGRQPPAVHGLDLPQQRALARGVLREP